MQANLFGDFVKGKNLSYFPNKIQQGILLHRKIDSFIDTHPAVLELLHILYEDLPKVAGIAVDLFFDHLLAKNWNQFHVQAYDDYIQRFYNAIDDSIIFYTPEFQRMLAKMKTMNWLHYYQFLEGLEKASNGLSSRISFPNQLIFAPQIFIRKEKIITEVFFNYMQDAQIEFQINS